MLWKRCFIFFSFVSSFISFNVQIPGGSGGGMGGGGVVWLLGRFGFGW